MKKQLLTMALLLSTGMIQTSGMEASPKMDKYLTEQFMNYNRHSPRIKDHYTNVGAGGSSQTYEYEGNGKWHLVSWWHGMQMRNFPKKELVRPELSYDGFVMKLKRVGQVKLLHVLENRFNALSSYIKRIEYSRNKTKASATEIEAFQEKLTEQHDYSGLISTLQKKLTPQEYSNFLRENIQLIVYLLE